jgi:hypothetical protein
MCRVLMRAQKRKVCWLTPQFRGVTTDNATGINLIFRLEGLLSVSIQDDISKEGELYCRSFGCQYSPLFGGDFYGANV